MGVRQEWPWIETVFFHSESQDESRQAIMAIWLALLQKHVARLRRYRRIGLRTRCAIGLIHVHSVFSE